MSEEAKRALRDFIEASARAGRADGRLPVSMRLTLAILDSIVHYFFEGALYIEYRPKVGDVRWGFTPMGKELLQLEALKRMCEPVGRALEEVLLRAWELKWRGYSIGIERCEGGAVVFARGPEGVVALGHVPLRFEVVREHFVDVGLVRHRPLERRLPPAVRASLLDRVIARAWELKAEGYRVEVRRLMRGSKVLARGARTVSLGSTPLHPLLMREALAEAGLIRPRVRLAPLDVEVHPAVKRPLRELMELTGVEDPRAIEALSKLFLRGLTSLSYVPALGELVVSPSEGLWFRMLRGELWEESLGRVVKRARRLLRMGYSIEVVEEGPGASAIVAYRSRAGELLARYPAPAEYVRRLLAEAGLTSG